MTVVVGVAAPDGLILAGESRTTYSPDGPNGRTRVSSDSAQKVFAVCERFGVATYGAAFVERKTIAGLMDEFEAGATEPHDIDQLSQALGEFFQTRMLGALKEEGNPWDPSQGPLLGFLVAGYDADGIGHLRDVRVPNEGGAAVFPSGPTTSDPGATWRGQIEVISRLMAGVDVVELGKAGIAIPDEIQGALDGLEYNFMLPVTVQDAVDCATFLIRTTIDMQRFSDGTIATPGGVPGCGGPIRVLHVGRRRAEWVSAPSLTAESRAGSAEGAVR